MASLLARKACVLVLSHARQSTACAAAACVIAIVLLSHVMSGGMPPILAIATWLVAESLTNEEHAFSTRSAQSELRAAEEPLTRPTSRLAIS